MKHFIISIVIISFICFYAASCEQEVFVEPNSDIINSHSKIFINSKPDGAKIYIAGKNTGFVTPDTINWIPEGKYDITLKKEFFFDTSFVLNAKLDSTTGILIDYSKNPRMLGNLVCLSTPAGSKIFLDNVYTGKKTPDTLKNLLPKMYSVKLDYPEYRKDSALVQVRSSYTSENNLYLEDTLDVISYSSRNSNIPNSGIMCVTEDYDGNMWFGTRHAGLIKYDGKKFQNYQYNKESFIHSPYANSLLTDENGAMWIGYSDALVKYDGVNWMEYHAMSMIKSLHQNNNSILAGTEFNGLIKYSEGKFSTITRTNSGLKSNLVVSACISNDDKIFVGFLRGGIDYYDGNSWNHLDSVKNGLPFNTNAAMTFDKTGTLFGLFHEFVNMNPGVRHCVAKYENGEWKKLFETRAEPKERTLYLDKKNNIWFSLGGYIYRIRNKSIVESSYSYIKRGIRRFQNNPSEGLVLSGSKVFVDSKENLWIIGGYNGLVKIKKGRWNY